MCSYVCSLCAGVQLGFERETYSVDESEETITLYISVLSGQLSDDLIVQLNTVDSTAQGMSTMHYYEGTKVQNSRL